MGEVLSQPDQERWTTENSYWATILADDNYLSGIGKDEIKVYTPRSGLTLGNPLSVWFIHQVLGRLEHKSLL